MPANEQPDTARPLPPDMQKLLQQLGAGGDGNALLGTLIGQSRLTPEASMLAGWLVNNADALDEQAADDADDEVDRLLRFVETEAGDASAEPPDDELDNLREVNDTVAAALGACPSCWGGDAGCPACSGNGAPGALDPDAALFTELVLPAVRRYRQRSRAG